MNEPLLKAYEVAERLGMSPRWVLEKWEAFDRGEPDGLPGFRLGPRPPAPVRFRWSEVEAWLRRQRGEAVEVEPARQLRLT
jgi:predicted DNA-binding transcriptional regulator AlpA